MYVADDENAATPNERSFFCVLLHCAANLAPQAEERRGETAGGGSKRNNPKCPCSECVPQSEEREVKLDAEPGTTR